jgi:hypothetical protein
MNLKEFTEFCRQERAVGPDPQIDTILTLAEWGHSPQDTLWLIGCYGAHHCVPSAFAVWGEWRVDDPRIQTQLFWDWLEAHWEALPVRPEMRSHRMLEKRARCLQDFNIWAREGHALDYQSYEEAWTHSIEFVKYYNRYMAIKVLEMVSRSVNPKTTLTDLRARNAWSPRKALAAIWEVDHNPYSDDPADIAWAEDAANYLIAQLRTDGVEVNHFQLQVLLCEYREATEGTYYPGASLDEELGYINIASEHFDPSAIYDARNELFPHEHLGEKHGWNDVRKEKYEVFKA